tara:strand:- start:9333 stop:11693 length:2361 start_codon:yes stop_codon:yes gene_type:complete
MRIDLQLYITETSSNTQIELFDFESIELIQTIQNVKDIKAVFADYSKSFTVPASKTNNKAFKHFYNPNIGRDLPSSLGLTFDSSKRIDAQLHINYRLFKKGRIQLDSVNMKNGKPYSYGLTFFGSTITLSDSLGEAKLDELTFLSDVDFDFTEDNLLSLLQTPQDITINSVTNTGALLVPLIAVSKALKYDSISPSKENNLYPNNNQKGLDINDVKPAIRVDAIINAIEAQFTNINFAKTTDTGSALSVSNVFFRDSNPQYYNLFLWLNKEKGQMKDREQFKPISHKLKGSEFTAARGDTSEEGLTDFYLPPTNNGALHIFDEKQVEYYLETRITPTNLTAPYSFVVYKDNEEFRRFDNLSGSTIPTTIMPRTFGTYGLATGSYTFYIETFSANDFTINFKIQKNRAPNINIFNILVATRAVSYDASISITTTKKINITQLLPNKMKILDILTSLFKMFNLTAQIDPLTDKINIKTLDQFYSEGSKIDITKYVDTTDHNITPTYPFKSVTFEYEGRNTILAKNYEDVNKKGWGTIKYTRPAANNQEVFEENSIGEEYTVSVPIEHQLFNRLFDQDDASDPNNKTRVQWGYSVDENENPVVGEPLLFYNVNNTDLSFGSETQIEVVKTGSSQLISTVNMPSNSVLLTDSNNINFHAEKNEFALVPFEKTLFNEHYRNYITDIFDIESRLFKFKAYIPADELIKIKLNDTIIIFDTEYRINQMTTNFVTGLTQLELLNKRTDEVLNPDGTSEPFVHNDNFSDIATDVSKDVVRVDTTAVTVDLTTRTV